MSTSANDILDASCLECKEAVVVVPFDYSHSPAPTGAVEGAGAAQPQPFERTATSGAQRTGDEVV